MSADLAPNLARSPHPRLPTPPAFLFALAVHLSYYSPPMFPYTQYTTRFQTFRTSATALPGWGKFLIMLAAIPGGILLALSIVAVLVSISVLLLLTVPAYKLVRLLQGRPAGSTREATVDPVDDFAASTGRKQVTVTVVD